MTEDATPTKTGGTTADDKLGTVGKRGDKTRSAPGEKTGGTTADDKLGTLGKRGGRRQAPQPPAKTTKAKAADAQTE